MASIRDLSDVIKFVTSFHEGRTLQSPPQTKLPALVSVSLCSVLPSLNPLSNHDYQALSASTRVSEHRHDGRRRRKVKELRQSGLSVDDLSDLLEMSKKERKRLSK